MDMLIWPSQSQRERESGTRKAQGPRHVSHGGDAEVSALLKEPVEIFLDFQEKYVYKSLNVGENPPFSFYIFT